MDRAIITKINGASPSEPWLGLLGAAGFLPTPRGLRFPRG